MLPNKYLFKSKDHTIRTNQMISVATLERFMKYFCANQKYFKLPIQEETLTCSNGEVQLNLTHGSKTLKIVALSDQIMLIQNKDEGKSISIAVTDFGPLTEALAERANIWLWD